MRCGSSRIGGTFFTLVATGSFNKNMTSGAGFIALAALTFGRWTLIGAFFAALFFGFANKLVTYLSAIGSPVPSQFLNMLPYTATLVAVACWSARSGFRRTTASCTSRADGSWGSIGR